MFLAIGGTRQQLELDNLLDGHARRRLQRLRVTQVNSPPAPAERKATRDALHLVAVDERLGAGSRSAACCESLGDLAMRCDAMATDSRSQCRPATICCRCHDGIVPSSLQSRAAGSAAGAVRQAPYALSR